MKLGKKEIFYLVLVFIVSFTTTFTIQGFATELYSTKDAVVEKTDEGNTRVVEVDDKVVEEVKDTKSAEEILVEDILEEVEPVEAEVEEVESEKTQDKQTEVKEEKHAAKATETKKAEVKEVKAEPKQVTQLKKEEVKREAKQEEKPAQKDSQKLENTNKPEEPKEKEEPAPKPKAPEYAPYTIYFNGKAVKYKNGGMSKAQSIIDSSSYASTWGGAPVFSGTDNQHTNFIQHNPGPFSGIWNAKEFIVTDGNGTPFKYRTTAVYEVDEMGYMKDGTDKYHRINSKGKAGHNEERITLFTCKTGDNSRRIVVEASIVR